MQAYRIAGGMDRRRGHFNSILLTVMLAVSLILSGCAAAEGPAENSGSGNISAITVSDDSGLFSVFSQVSADASADAYIGSLQDIAAGEVIDRKSVDYTELDRYFTSSRITDEVFSRIKGKSFGDDCTVSRDDLRYLKLLYNGYDSKIHVGELIINKAADRDVLSVMKALFTADYAISRM